MTRLLPGARRLSRLDRPRRAALPVLPVVGACAAAVALSGCGVGQNAETLKPYNVSEGLQADRGDVRVANAKIVAGGGATGGLSFTIANLSNTQTYTLRGLDVAGKPAKLAGGSGDVPPAGVLRVGTGSSITVTLPAVTLTPGTYAPLVLHFAGATGDLAMNAAVVPAGGFTPQPDMSASANASSVGG